MSEQQRQQNGREDKRPWDKWYWQDFETDTGLRLCSLAAQGLWMRMLSIMAKSKKKGYLLDGESKMQSKALARLVGETVDVVEPLLADLRVHDVFSETEDGIIFNRRMARQTYISEVRSKAGKMGGRPKKQNEEKQAREKKQPSVSASVSASGSLIKLEEKSSNSEAEVDAKFEEFWSAYPSAGRFAKRESRVKFGALCKRGELKEFVEGFHGYTDWLKHKKVDDGFEQTPMYAKTFLGGRWREYIGYVYKVRL